MQDNPILHMNLQLIISTAWLMRLSAIWQIKHRSLLLSRTLLTRTLSGRLQTRTSFRSGNLYCLILLPLKGLSGLEKDWSSTDLGGSYHHYCSVVQPLSPMTEPDSLDPIITDCLEGHSKIPLTTPSAIKTALVLAVLATGVQY